MKRSILQNLTQCAFDFDTLDAQPVEDIPSVHPSQTTPLKQCIECKEWLSPSEFTVKSNARDGLEYWCKKCNNIRKQDSDLRSHYGITVKQYDRMLEEQGGVCACCGQSETRKRIRRPKGSEEIGRLHVDHDHQTGKVRALLCGDCNTALGIMDEDPERIQKLKEYAEWCKAGGFSMIATQDPPQRKRRPYKKRNWRRIEDEKVKTYAPQYRKCNKDKCSTCKDGEGHGPYWFAYWKEEGKLKSEYIGKNKPI